jgi:hypothetical protein
MTLLEFAGNSEYPMQDFQARILRDSPVSVWRFLGVTERFEESLAILSRLLNWPTTPVLHLNPGGSKTSVPEGEAEYIREHYLSSDMELYTQANKDLDKA